MLFVYGIGYGIGKFLDFKVDDKQILLPAILIFLCYLLLQKKKEIRIPFAVVSICLVCVTVWGTYKDIKHFSYWKKFYTYLLQWRFFGPLKEKYVWIVFAVLDLVLFLFYLWLQKMRFGNEIVTIGSLSFLLWQLAWGYEWEKLPVLALLFIILSSGLKTWKKYRLKQEAIDERSTYLLLGLLLLAVAFLPVSKEPVSMQPVLERLITAGEWIEKKLGGVSAAFGERDFNTQIAGFSDSGQSFFGKLRDDTDWEMLMLSGDISTKRVDNYFTGTIKEIYENGNWSADDTESQKGLDGEVYTEREWMLEEHLYYLYQAKIPMVENEKFCSRNMYRFTYEDLRSSTIFYPTNCYLLFPEHEREAFFEEQKRLCFENPKEKGESYQAYGLKINTEQENFLNYLRGEEQEPAEGEDCFSECMEVLHLREAEVDEIMDAGWEPLLLERENRIQEKDLQLPENCDPRIKELADEITKDATNDYDKAVAIRDYLKENYIYNKAVERPPKDTDPVSYFLFESKEGYCTYFASAMTLLCRASGIPARYVEGIYCNYENKIENKYLILGSNSHAWTEVYIENYGFLTFDATPGFDATFTDWKIQEIKHTNGPVTAQNVPQKKEKVREKTPTVVTKEKPWKKRIFVGALILIIIGFCAVFFLLFQKIAYMRMPRRERARISMKRILNQAKKKGMGNEKDETLRQYTKRIADDLKEPDKWKEVVRIYEQVYYGEKEITEEELQKIEHYKWEVKA